MTTTSATQRVDVWRERIRAEYLEMPGLRLTQPQIQRFWGLDSATCRRTVAALVASRVLRQTREGQYVLASAAY